MFNVEFLRARLSGTRFDGGKIPLDVLADLSVMKEMVLEVAKWRFMQAQPDLRQSPRGFTTNVDLRLTGMGTGSATAVIEITSYQSALPKPVPYQEYYEQALYAIIKEVKLSGQGPSDEHLPDEYLSYFNRIGRSLRDDESMEIISVGHKQSARLTKKTRNQLLTRLAKTKRMQDVTLHGTIPEADQDRMTFQLRPIYGDKVVCPIREQYLPTIIQAFDGYHNDVRVLVQGVGLYNRQNRLDGLDSVAHVSLLDPLDVPARLDEFRDMKDGWLEGHGLAPPHTGLNWLTTVFTDFYPDGIPLPHTYPTPEGDVQMEWTQGDSVSTLEINLTSHSGEWFSFNRRSDKEVERVLDLNDPKSWQWLANKIRNNVMKP